LRIVAKALAEPLHDLDQLDPNIDTSQFRALLPDSLKPHVRNARRVHCQTSYSGQRAPKSGQRNFCPACREQGIPKAYAVKDFRQRQRQARKR
jgi:hypothetical protein